MEAQSRRTWLLGCGAPAVGAFHTFSLLILHTCHEGQPRLGDIRLLSVASPWHPGLCSAYFRFTITSEKAGQYLNPVYR